MNSNSTSFAFGVSVATFLLVCCSLFVLILSSGCGGQDTDQDGGSDTVADTGVSSDGNMTDTNDSSDGSGDNTLSQSEVKQKVCKKCQNRDKQCPSDMEEDMKQEYKDPDIGKLADQFCKAKDLCAPYKKKSYLVDGGEYRCNNEGKDAGNITLKIFVYEGKFCTVKGKQRGGALIFEKAEKVEKRGEKKFFVQEGNGAVYTCTLIQ